MKDNTEIKKESIRPPEPKLALAPEEAPKEIALVPFDDGKMFKYMPHPSGKSIAICGRVAGNRMIQLAGTPHAAIADMICNAVNAIAEAAKVVNQQNEKQVQDNNSPSNQS